jgi:hypothetical protein
MKNTRRPSETEAALFVSAQNEVKSLLAAQRNKPCQIWVKGVESLTTDKTTKHIL